jgi:hypothetical protein
MPRFSSALVRIVRRPSPYPAQRPGALERFATAKELTEAREQQSTDMAA